jgi:hypothetical protein
MLGLAARHGLVKPLNAMKPQHLVAGAVVLLAMASFVQSYLALRRADEIKATLLRLEARRSAPVAAERAVESSAPVPLTSSVLEDDQNARIQAIEARMREMENTSNELADAWNRFAADEDEKRRKASMRGWGPEQAAGAPDSKGAGDQQTAWASLQADGGEQWLETSYAKPVEIAQVRVLENDNAGAIVRIVAILDGGTEIPLWSGEEPKLQAPADQYFSARPGIVASKIRVVLDTNKVPGWNEIDAVELIGRDGSRQWATSATASSTYASPREIRFGSMDLFLGR